jgi:hypothetical protein
MTRNVVLTVPTGPAGQPKSAGALTSLLAAYPTRPLGRAPKSSSAESRGGGRASGSRQKSALLASQDLMAPNMSARGSVSQRVALLS